MRPSTWWPWRRAQRQLCAVLAFLQPQLVSIITDMFEDNQGAIDMAENSISGGRTKHFDVRYHFIWELSSVR